MNKKLKFLLGSIFVSLLVLYIIIYKYPGLPDNKSLSEVITQGEIIAGIAVGIPTICTWIFSIEENQSKTKKDAAIQVLEIIKHYDNELLKLCKNMKENINIFPSQLKNNFQNFNKSTEVFENEYQQARLNYEVLLSIVSESYDIENVWKSSSEDLEFLGILDSISESMEIILTELFKHNMQSCIANSMIKKFVKLKFRGEDYFKTNCETSLVLENKIFVDCSFATEFLKGARFQNCTFLFDDTEGGTEDFPTIFKANCIIDPENIEKNSIDLYTILQLERSDINMITNKQKYNSEEIWDFRNNIQLDEYIYANRSYEISLKTIEDKKHIQETILDYINQNEDIKDEFNEFNSRISISKNYLNKKIIKKYGTLQWIGWHAIMENYLRKNSDVENYIFVVTNNPDVGYFIIFKKKKFEELLSKKHPNNNGKYNFYFGQKIIN